MVNRISIKSQATGRCWTQGEARRVLDALASSGMTTSQFAKREGIDPSRLRKWRRRLKVAPFASAAAEDCRFVEVRAPNLVLVEIELRSGRVLRVADSIDAGVLRRLIQVLEEAQAC